MSLKFFQILLNVSAAHAQRSRELFQTLDLSPGQPKILWNLRIQEGYMQKDLAAKCKIAPPSMTSLLKGMEQKGLIRKEKRLVSGGKRAYCIYLTDEGKRLAAIVAVEIDRLEEICFRDFDPADQETLFQLLERVGDNLLSY